MSLSIINVTTEFSFFFDKCFCLLLEFILKNEEFNFSHSCQQHIHINGFLDLFYNN